MKYLIVTKNVINVYIIIAYHLEFIAVDERFFGILRFFEFVTENDSSITHEANVLWEFRAQLESFVFQRFDRSFASFSGLWDCLVEHSRRNLEGVVFLHVLELFDVECGHGFNFAGLLVHRQKELEYFSEAIPKNWIIESITVKNVEKSIELQLNAGKGKNT